MAKDNENEGVAQGEGLEANAENKGFEVAKTLVAQKFAAAGGKEAVINTLDFVKELMDAGLEGFSVDDISAWFKMMQQSGYDVKPLVKIAGKTPSSWKIVSAPALNAEAPVIESVPNKFEGSVVESAVNNNEQLREVQLAALEAYIASLGEGVAFTGKDATTALQADEKLEKPSNARVVALLVQLRNAGKVKWSGGDDYESIPEKKKSGEVPQEFIDVVKEMADKGSEMLSLDQLQGEVEKYTQIAVAPSTVRHIAQQLVEKGVLEAVPGSDSEWSIVSTGTKSEVKDAGVTYAKMLDALAAVAETTDMEGLQAAFKAAGMAGTVTEVMRALPGLAAEGLIKENDADTWEVNKAEVAKRQNPAEVESVTVETDAEKLAQARLQAVEEYINTQADAGGEITQAGALAMLEADAAMGEVTDMDVFKIFEDFEKAGKIKFISRGRYERVVQEDEEDAVGDTEAKKQELFEARLFVLESFVEKAAESGEDITITSVKAALEAEGDLGTDIPEAEIEALLAKLVDNGTIRVQTDGKYEVVTEAEDESDEAGAETFTSEQLAVAHRWLRRAINRPGVKFIDVVTLARALAEAGQGGLDTAGSVALLGKLAADGLIAPFLTDSENSARNAWKINPEAVRALIAEEDETERESATDFYERTGASKNDLVAFARDVLRLPHMTAGIVEDRYTGEQLQAILDEYTKSLNQGRNYRVPSTTAWDAFPDEDLLGEEEVDEEEPEEEPEEEKPGLLGRIFGKKKSKKPVRAERPGVETSDSADIAAWKVSRRGKSFINSLAELNGDLALGGQDFFDQDNETDIEQAMIAQEMFDTHYAKVHTIFDRQLEAMTGYSMYDIFNLGPEGEKMYEDFGKWVVRQAYLDAGTPQGRGRLEKIISLDVQAQENASFLATVVSTERLQELRDRRDDWKTAYKITRITSGDARDARDRLGKAVPTSWFAEVKGIRTARRYEEYVREVEEDYNQAPQVKAEIAKQREQIIAELDSMNGLLDAEGDKTSPASGFAKMLRSMIDKIGSTEKPTTGEVTPTEREQAEQAEQVLQAVKKVQAQREQIGASAFAFYDEQEQNKAGLEILRLEARVTKLIQQEFAKALEGKIAAGRAKGIVDFRAETLAMVERLAGNLTGSKARRNATAALAKVLEEKTKSFAKTEPKGAQLEVLKELEKSIALLNKRMKS